MPWIQLKLNTTGANAEDLSDALMEAGAVSITFQDTHDTPVFEPLPGETRLWGDTDVIGLFDAETDMNDVVAILENHPLLGAGFVVPAEKLMISIHGGYSGIHEGNRVIPALLRVSFFPRTIQDDGMFYYAQAGAGFHLPAGFKTRVSLMSGLGAGYRIALSERFSLDLILTAMAAFSHPPVPNPEGPGFVAEQNVRTSDAHYGALSLTIAVNL